MQTHHIASLHRRHFFSKWSRGICSFACLLITTQIAAATPYAFVNIADNTGPLLEFTVGRSSGAPTINNSRTVAFLATLDAGGQIIAKGNGGPIETVADAAAGFVSAGEYPDINNAGTIVFSGVRAAGVRGIYASNGGSPTPVVDNSGQLDFFGSRPSINGGGAVAFSATFDGGGSANFRSDGGLVTTIADSAGPLSSFSGFQLNDSGSLVFWANRDAGGSGIFQASGGPVETVTDSSGPLSSFGLNPSINGAGTLFYGATADIGVQSIFVRAGGTTTTLANNSGPFGSFGDLAINELGGIAFQGFLDFDGSGIFTGPDTVADKVIRTGDSLFGSTLQSLNFYRGLNDNGDIAFYYSLSNGVRGIAMATPIPEPTAAALLAVASALLATTRQRIKKSLT